ncbi:hypothetical protein G7Y89_g4191 [Cudoniella acicularis]|uniref:Uncharacterized protein n=1 Tax=Cudoniella acicularis TaxID=354080 RepID=A0A8H4RPY5_9HELO|nr:hypothetical protein G7Y89_g4191 [Cudoniella acicularis]
MPLILRPEKSYYKLISERYVDDIVNGEAVDAARDRSILKAPFNLDALMGLFDSRDSSKVNSEWPFNSTEEVKFPETAWIVIEEMKRGLVKMVRERSADLRVSCIEIR